MVVQVPDAGQYLSNNANRIAFGKLASLCDALEQLSAHRKLKRQVIFGPRFKPFVEFHLRQWDLA